MAFLTDLLSSLVRPFTSTGESASAALQTLGLLATNSAFRKSATGQKLTKDEIKQLANTKTNTNILGMNLGIDQKKTKTTDYLKDLAKQEAGLAAWGIPIGGQAVTGFGKTLVPAMGKGILGKYLVPGAVSGGLNAYSQDSDIATGAALGAGGAAIVPALSGLLSKGSGKVADTTKDMAKTISLKGHRFNPTQVTTFEETTGEGLQDFVMRNKLFDRGTKQVKNLIDPLQTQFDDLAINSGRTVKPEEIALAFKNKADEFRATDVPDLVAVGDKLENTVGGFLKKYQNREIPVADITALRKSFDKVVKKFANTQEQKSINQLSREILQENVQNAVSDVTAPNGMNLQQLGKELQKMYAFKKIAGKQSNLGKGSLALGLTQLLGGGIGSSVGGVPGAVGGVAVTAALNSPKATELFVNGLQSVSNASGNLATKGLSPELSKILQLSARQTAPLLSGKPADNQSQSNNAEAGQKLNNHTTSTISQDEILTQGNEQYIKSGNDFYSIDKQWKWDNQAQDWVPNQQVSQSGMPDFQQMAMQDMMTTGGKNLDKIIKLAKFMTPEGSGLNAKAKEKLQQTQGANAIIDQIENSFNQAGARGRIGGALAGVASKYTESEPNVRAYEALRKGSASLLAKALGNVGTLSDRDIAAAVDLLPTINDSPQEAQLKLGQLRGIIKNIEQSLYNSPDSSTDNTAIEQALAMLGAQ